MVCAARAAAQGRTSVAAYSDPTALALLPDDAREPVERFRAGAPTDAGERLQQAMLQGRARMMVPRTVAIDDAIRAAPAPQLVILGAGLDGRAWRMPELADTIVFEVDHPDSQRQKQARVASLSKTAREVRFVPVDFTRDRLDDALSSAGHDRTRPTMWIWEGVVMYLERADIEATLRVVEARSAPGSRMVVLYLSRSIVRLVVGSLLRLVGEPFRSFFTAESARALLGQFGFRVTQDDDLATTSARMSDELGRARRLLADMRLVTAVRA
jgi:methyltransferase (TIGR00027 family)